MRTGKLVKSILLIVLSCFLSHCSSLRICESGMKECSGQHAFTCLPNGRGWKSKHCGPDEFCTQGLCMKKRLCEFGERKCDGQRILTCAHQGTGWEVSHCDSKQLCVEGSCQKVLCRSGERRCQGQLALVCDRNGTDWLGHPCQEGYRCLEGICSKKACLRTGETICENATTLKICQPNGSWKQESCQRQHRCEEGRCVMKEGLVGASCEAHQPFGQHCGRANEPWNTSCTRVSQNESMCHYTNCHVYPCPKQSRNGIGTLCVDCPRPNNMPLFTGANPACAERCHRDSDCPLGWYCSPVRLTTYHVCLPQKSATVRYVARGQAKSCY